MKKTIALGLSLLLCAALFAGCGVAEAQAGFPTETASAQAVALQTIEPPAPALPSLAEQLDAPAEYSGGFTAAEGKLECTFDAWVEIPQAKTLPTFGIEASPFTQEQVDGMLSYLFGDAPLYDEPTQLTKEEVEWCIGSAERQLEGISNGENSFPGSAEEVEQYLDKMRRQLETAPETVEPQLSNGKLRTIRPLSIGYEAESYEGLAVRTDPADPSSAYFSVNNGNDLIRTGKRYSTFEAADGVSEATSTVTNNYRSGAELMFSDNSRLQEFYDLLPDGDYGTFFNKTPVPVKDGRPQQDSADGISLTPRQALSKAQEFFTAAGTDMSLHYMSLVTVNPDNMPAEAFAAADGYTAYNMVFVRRTNEANSLYVYGEASDPSPEDPDYGKKDVHSWPYETCNITVDDTGVTGVEWHSPLSIVRELPQEQALLPFSEIMDTFETLLAQTNKRDTDQPEVTKLRFHVNHIALGYFRVSEPGSITAGTLVPAWGFYGYGERQYTDGFDPTTFPDGASPYLLLNAATGEVIQIGDLIVG